MTDKELDQKLETLGKYISLLLQAHVSTHSYIQGILRWMDDLSIIADPTIAADTMDQFKRRLEDLRNQLEVDNAVNTINKIAESTLVKRDEEK